MRNSLPPAASRSATSPTTQIGLEYHTDLGPRRNFSPSSEEQRNLYAIVDFKIGRFDVNAGVGYGLTPDSDRLMHKMIIGTDLNEGVSDKSGDASKQDASQTRVPAEQLLPGPNAELT